VSGGGSAGAPNDEVTDVDGNTYQTVLIGDQRWTSEHLRVTRFNDGTEIPLVQNAAAWGATIMPAYCYYGGIDDPTEVATYGLLYNWHAVDSEKLAPEGWRVPNADDWMQLRTFLIESGFNFDNTTSENKIAKSMASQIGWSPSTNEGAIGNDPAANNSSGFGAHPAGIRDAAGEFGFKGSRAIMWASTEFAAPFGYFADLNAQNPGLRWADDWKELGLSVRLVKE
jgi:uncharacterized protein (TIGR02145 family)